MQLRLRVRVAIMTSQHSIERQKARVLDRLKAGPVTSCELTRELDILRPASRIFDLRSDGHEIVMHWTYDRINGTDHRVGRYVLMKEQPTDPQTRKGPGNATNITEAQQQTQQRRHITTEALGTVVVGVLFASVMWMSILGMIEGQGPGNGFVLGPVAENDHAK